MGRLPNHASFVDAAKVMFEVRPFLWCNFSAWSSAPTFRGHAPDAQTSAMNSRRLTFHPSLVPRSHTVGITVLGAVRESCAAHPHARIGQVLSFALGLFDMHAWSVVLRIPDPTTTATIKCSVCARFGPMQCSKSVPRLQHCNTCTHRCPCRRIWENGKGLST